MSERTETQCCMLLRDGVTRCTKRGEPQGDSTYACDDCLEYLEECLNAAAKKHHDRHTNN